MDWYFQLYSARNTPLDEALEIISESGYAGVEAYRENFDDPDRFESQLKAHRLSCPSMHVNIEPLREDLAGQLKQARRFGTTHIVCPYLAETERPVDATGWQVLARELRVINQNCKDAGFVFAWHNHDFEFNALPDGSMPMDHLLEHCPAMHWEVDVAWIVRAGVDPVPAITRHLARISAVHVKDIARETENTDEDGWADVGHGTLDWPALLAQLQPSPATVYAVEHDNPSNLKRFATRSYATLDAL